MTNKNTRVIMFNGLRREVDWSLNLKGQNAINQNIKPPALIAGIPTIRDTWRLLIRQANFQIFVLTASLTPLSPLHLPSFTKRSPTN